MIIILQREPPTEHCTMGTLYIPGVLTFDTLEDLTRPKKIPNETAIDAGTYEIIINQSARFGRYMPILLGVPNFSGIRIHNGFTDKNTSGCILIGIRKADNLLTQSGWAFDVFYAWLYRTLIAEKVHIKILNHFELKK